MCVLSVFVFEKWTTHVLQVGTVQTFFCLQLVHTQRKVMVDVAVLYFIFYDVAFLVAGKNAKNLKKLIKLIFYFYLILNYHCYYIYFIL